MEVGICLGMGTLVGSLGFRCLDVADPSIHDSIRPYVMYSSGSYLSNVLRGFTSVLLDLQASMLGGNY